MTVPVSQSSSPAYKKSRGNTGVANVMNKGTQDELKIVDNGIGALTNSTESDEDQDQAEEDVEEGGMKEGKKPTPKVLSREERTKQRQKQIALGKSTDGYKRFIAAVPRQKRTKEHPRTPTVQKECSKRSWDGLVRQWRRLLHDFDAKNAAEKSGDKSGEQSADSNSSSSETTPAKQE